MDKYIVNDHATFLLAFKCYAPNRIKVFLHYYTAYSLLQVTTVGMVDLYGGYITTVSVTTVF